MADIRLNNRLDVSLVRASDDKRVLAAPPAEIPPNTTLAWHIDGAGSVSYQLASAATGTGTGGAVKRFTLEWSLSPEGAVQCRARDATRAVRIVVELRPDGALCTVAARHRRVPPPPRRGRVVARLIPLVAGAVIVALLAGTLAALGFPSDNHRGAPPTPGVATATSTATVTPTATPTPIPHAALKVSRNKAYSEQCTGAPAGSYTVTLDNSGSNVPVAWQFTASNGWASASPASGTVGAGRTATFKVIPQECVGVGKSITYHATLHLSFPKGGSQGDLSLSDTISGPALHPNLKVTENQSIKVICDSDVLSYSITIDNLGGNVPVMWQFVPMEYSGTNPWAVASPPSGTVDAGQGSSTITVNIQFGTCGTVYHAYLHLTFPAGGSQADIPLTEVYT